MARLIGDGGAGAVKAEERSGAAYPRNARIWKGCPAAVAGTRLIVPPGNRRGQGGAGAECMLLQMNLGLIASSAVQLQSLNCGAKVGGAEGEGARRA